MEKTSLHTLQHLVDRLDAAVRLGEIHTVTSHVKTALCDLIRSHSLEIPDRYCRPLEDRYARRLLHRNDALGYTAVVMTWGPGHETRLHDHAGMWCVEAVIAGEMNVARYDLVSAFDDRFRFALVEQVRAGIGSSGALIPPYDYHVLSNALADRPSVTLHVYGGEMDHCSIYVPEAGDLWSRHEKQLGYDA